MTHISSSFKTINPLFNNPHLSTIYASLLRRIPRVKFQRERIDTPDGDFLDLDWSKRQSKKLVLILAGLEGKSWSLYSRAAIRHFNNNNWDAVCMNYRGCSGENNRLLNGYHMGASDDVRTSLNHILANNDYQEIWILGYSLGGNLALKYLGEEGEKLPAEIKGTVSFSVPLNLKKSNARLDKWYNWHYLKWFMLTLNLKANRKKKQFPGKIDDYRGFFMSGSFTYFDKYFTAPANGFANVEEYWAQSTSKPYLKNIKVPCLIIASEDDTFISEDCIPTKEVESNNALFLEITKNGGHCGFIRKFFEKVWWMEERALKFIESID